MTPAQHTALARLSDGEWRVMQDHAPGVLARLYRADMIRCDFFHVALNDRLWTITPDGIAALEAAQ